MPGCIVEHCGGGGEIEYKIRHAYICLNVSNDKSSENDE